MDLFILGSGTCTPTAERGPSGLVINAGGRLLLFDPGSGSLRQMARMGLDFRKIDFIGLTHFHPDHVSDLVPFLFATNYTPDFTRSFPLQIFGPRGLKDFYELLHGVYGRWIEAQTYPLMFQEIESSILTFAEFTLEGEPMNHSVASTGYRINAEGRSLTYSGDTDYSNQIARLGRNADVLILECSFPDERKVPGHLTPALAGRIAREASCRTLLLTHFYPVFEGLDILSECRREFPGTIVLAEDGMQITVGNSTRPEIRILKS